MPSRGSTRSPAAPDRELSGVTPSSYTLPSVEEVRHALLVVGLAGVSIALVLIALADPEPLTKLLAAGLSDAAVLALLTELGYFTHLEPQA
jgi:hypothetical protein